MFDVNNMFLISGFIARATKLVQTASSKSMKTEMLYAIVEEHL